MLQNFFNILPQSITTRLLSAVKKRLMLKFKAESRNIPIYEFEQKHINNLKLLLNRKELLKWLPKNAVVAELGVDEGFFSQQIVSICRPQKLHLIDYWGMQRYSQEKRKKVEAQFVEQIKLGSVEINLGLSTMVVDQFRDNYFDWIYIDTDHSYKTTLEELVKFEPKMKVGGIITGHDYINGFWNGLVRYGVVEAVHEFCVKHDWEMLYQTSELQDHPSFAIRKIH
jgi:hypothetical protein